MFTFYGRSRAFIIANMSDEFDAFYQRSDLYEKYLFEEKLLSERSLFWSTANDLLIASPFLIPEDYINWVGDLFKKRIKLLYPPNSVQPLFEFLSEPQQIHEIKKWVNSGSLASLIAYSASESLENFISILSENQIYLNIDTLPDKSFWPKRRFFSSKLGFKHTLKILEGDGLNVTGPDYFSCKNLEQTRDAILEFLRAGKPVIVKPNDGNSGIGTHRFYPYDLDTSNKINHSLENNLFIKENQVVVEELITSRSGSLMSPSLELLVPLPPENPVILYWSQQLISPSGGFQGIIIDMQEPQNNKKTKAENIALAIAAFLQREGYRGIFDIDFLIRDDGLFIPIEMNLRHTGGTHVFLAADSLLGKRMKEYIILSREEFDIGLRCSWEYFCDCLKDLFISEEKMTGLLPININMTQNSRLGFVAIGSSGSDVFSLQKEVVSRLHK